MITNVEAVFFDLDDTLWAVAPVILRAERKIYAYLQEHFPRLTDAMDLEAIRKTRSQVYASRPDLAHDLTTSRRLAFESMLSDFDYDPQAAVALTDLFLDYRNRVALYPDVIPALERLRHHFKLVVVTNGNADIERVGIGEFFSAQIRAEEAGCRKPLAGIFELACSTINVEPSSVIHVGDHPIDDIQGAIGAGIRSIWMNRQGEPWVQAHHPDAEVADLTGLVALLRQAN